MVKYGTNETLGARKPLPSNNAFDNEEPGTETQRKA